MNQPNFTLVGHPAAGAMAVPFPVGNMTTNVTATPTATQTFNIAAPTTLKIVTRSVNATASATLDTVATAIAVIPEALEGVPTLTVAGQTGVVEDVVVVQTESVWTPYKEVTHIVDRLSGKVFNVTSFVNQTMASGLHRNKELAGTVAHVTSFSMAILRSILQHATAYVKHMTHEVRASRLRLELPTSNGTVVAAGAHPEVLALLNQTHLIVAEIGGTARNVVEKLGMAQVARAVYPAIMQSEDLMVAVEELLTSTDASAAAAVPEQDNDEDDDEASDDEDDDEDDDDDDDGDDDEESDDKNEFSGRRHGFRAGVRRKLRGAALRFMGRRIKSIARFLLGDTYDDAKDYFKDAVEGPDYSTGPMAVNGTGNATGRAFGPDPIENATIGHDTSLSNWLLMHIDSVDKSLEHAQSELSKSV